MLQSNICQRSCTLPFRRKAYVREEVVGLALAGDGEAFSVVVLPFLTEHKGEVVQLVQIETVGQGVGYLEVVCIGG